jgi:hypothetical protein
MTSSGQEAPGWSRARVRRLFGLCDCRIGRRAYLRARPPSTGASRGRATTEHSEGPLPAAWLLPRVVPRSAARPATTARPLRAVAVPSATGGLSDSGLRREAIDRLTTRLRLGRR